MVEKVQVANPKATHPLVGELFGEEIKVLVPALTCYAWMTCEWHRFGAACERYWLNEPFQSLQNPFSSGDLGCAK